MLIVVSFTVSFKRNVMSSSPVINITMSMIPHMPVGIINKERFKQLGLPPMELAESSVNGRNNKGCLLSVLQKLIIILILTSLGAGIYIVAEKILSNYDSPRNTGMVLVKENSKAPKTIHVISLLNATPEKETIRKKRDIDSTEDSSLDFDDFNSLNLNDVQLQKAREIIMKHDILCNEEDKQGICKDLVTNLKMVTKSNSPLKGKKTKLSNINEHEQDEITPTEVSKREILPTTHLDEIVENLPKYYPKKGYPYSLPHVHSDPNNCLMALLKRYSHRKELSGTTFDDLIPSATHFEHQLSPQTRFYSPNMQNPHVRDAEGTNRKIHPQDVDILMSFLTPKSELTDIEQQSNSTNISCSVGMVPCLSGDLCIDKKQWCDGNVDCADVSDEAKCGCKSRVDKSRLCDGYFDCPFGEDEMGCHGCKGNTFSCEDMNTSHSTCFTKEQRCNNVVDCPNHRDEIECNMLAPSLVKKPIFAISNTEGFLHRNFKGEWYAVCKNPYMWAHDACRRETGLIIRPPFLQIVPIDPMLKINYINTDPGGLLQTTDSCKNSSAVYVTCADMLCGTRVQSASQLLRENIAIENHLFGRNKRFLQSNHPFPLMYYGNRWKRNVDSANATTNYKSKFDTPKTEDAFDKIRNKRTESRVVGGKPSQPAAWPWVVAIYRNGMFHCGGVVVTQSWVISAAHCVAKFWDHYYEVQVGMLRRFSFSPQEQSHKVTHIIVNQHYSQSDMKNDLSLLKIEPAIQFSRWVRPICLPSPDTAGKDWIWGPSPGTMCTAVGWGATVEHGPDPDHMREVEVPVWDKCKHTEDRVGKEICAGLVEGGKDACQGDSGGPLLCRNPLNTQQWYIVGIVSHGDGCARKGEPGVYTRVSLFVKWIRYHISSNSLPIIQPLQECPGFKCESGISKCLPTIRRCDKIVDCLGGEDELNCKYTRKLIENTPKIDLIEAIFAAKEAKPDENKTLNFNKYDYSTTSVNTESSTNTVQVITSNPYSSDTQSNEGEIDFQHASTIEMAISKSSESLSSSESLNSSDESSIVDFATTTNQVDLLENIENSNAIAIDIKGESLESRSSILANLQDESTEKVFSNTFEFNLGGTEIGEQNTKTTTSFRKENNESDLLETTTYINMRESTQFFDMNTHRPVDSNGEDTVLNKKSDDLTKNNPNSSHNITSNIISVKKENFTSNVIHSKSEAAKQLPNFDDKSATINKMNEDMVSAELQPATVRRKHRVPNEFLCRRIYQIIPYHHRCNRKADCEDGTDELDCSCTDYLTTFDEDLICDGVFDCADGHDESSCCSCDEDQFLCKQSQICLPLKNVCDGKPQCPEGEDELDCFTLSNGKEIYYDLAERPEINLEGYLTKKSFKDWHVVCDDKLTLDQQEQAATHICRYLGFGAANKFYVKYINVKEDEIAERSSIRNKRSTLQRVPIHFVYRQRNETTDTTRQVLLKDAQVIQEQCVPNITKTCKSLYVFCDHSLFTHFDEFDNNILLRKTETISTHKWPWAAKIFVEGEYRCTGVLINLSWVLISETCLWDAMLIHNYVSVVLGSHKTLDTVNGMYEQAYQVNAKKDIYNSKVTMLHLKEPAHYSIFVKPMIVSSSFNRLDAKSICVAIGQDNKNKTISITLEETNENCNPSNRCFVRKTSESVCSANAVHHHRHWAGIISCHTDQGWFPAASFVDSRGECGLNDRINATDIDNLKNEIYHLKGIKSISPVIDIDNCEGIRCGRGHCVSLENVCDGVRSCEDGNDESESACKKKNSTCSMDPYYKGCGCSVGQMKCRNGKCIAKELFRDGNDDCGDRTDEPGQTTCSHYLARVMPSRLCDGILHCHDRSDEDPMFCKCFAKNTYKCGTNSNDNHCVALDMVCDGIQDCPNAEDEKTCIALNSVPGTPPGTGQVMIRSHGVWYSKCYSKENYTKSELEEICAELGFISGHAKQIHQTNNYVIKEHNNLVIDSFNDVTFNNNTVIKMRNTHHPIAKAIIDKQLENCFPVFIECL